MRICSLLPSATEILYALGLGDSVVGVTHECDFPAEAATKACADSAARGSARCCRRNRPPSKRTCRARRKHLRGGRGITAVAGAGFDCDAGPLPRLRGFAGRSGYGAHAAAEKAARSVAHAAFIGDVWDDIRNVGDATQRRREAQALAITLEQKVAAIEAKAAHAKTRPRVLCLEWLDPFYVGGHWVPEMVAKAGGEDVLGRAGEPSFRVSAEQIAASDAEIIVVMPCGFYRQTNGLGIRHCYIFSWIYEPARSPRSNAYSRWMRTAIFRVRGRG